MKKTPEQIIQSKNHLKSMRGNWETHWQELAEYNIPNKNNFTRSVVKGEKKAIELFDSTSMVSCDLLSSALHGMLTNPNTLWFMLSTANNQLNSTDYILEYLQDLTQRMHGYLNNSNFQTELHEYYLDLCAFGTGSMTVEEDKDTLFRFSTKYLGELFIEENHLGMIEEVYRCFKWKAPQIVEQFAQGIDQEDKMAMEAKVGSRVAAAFYANKGEEFEIIHCVYKEFFTKTPKVPFLSQYILEIDKKELSDGKFRRFPYIISRWSKVSGEVYGRSPAMNALPEAKTLNLMAKSVIKGAQKTVDPPVQMPDDGFVRPLRTSPSSVNYYRAGSNDKVTPIFNDVRIDYGVEIMRERQEKIQRAFYIDRLNLANNDRMTQMEVGQRVQEQLRFMGPMLGRQQTEFLKPLIDRILDIMIEKDAGSGNILGDVPDELTDIDLDVMYTSPIARAQKISEAEALNAALTASAPMLQLDPSAADVIDPDKVVRVNFEIYGAPQKVLRKAKEVKTIREARSQAQQAAVEQQQQAHGAEVANKAAPLLKS